MKKDKKRIIRFLLISIPLCALISYLVWYSVSCLYRSPYKRPRGVGVFTCNIVPLSDYKKPCQDSSECKGECIYIAEIPDFCTKVDDYIHTCSKTIKGICSNRMLHCDSYSEVQGNKIYKHFGLCD